MMAVSGPPCNAGHSCTVPYHNQTLCIDDWVVAMRQCSLFGFAKSQKTRGFGLPLGIGLGSNVVILRDRVRVPLGVSIRVPVAISRVLRS